MPDPVQIFVSYAHEDDAHRERLEQVLRPLQREFGLECFTDRAIVPGQDWSQEIDARLRDADLILLLVSDAFLASDYIHGVEMRVALEEQREDSTRIIPVIVRACDWTTAPFAAFQALPRDGRAVASWPNTDEAWADVARGLRKAVERILARHDAGFEELAYPAEVAARGGGTSLAGNAGEVLRFLESLIGSQRTTLAVQLAAIVLLVVSGLAACAAALAGVGLLVPAEARAVQAVAGLFVSTSSLLLVGGQVRRRERVAALRYLSEQASREQQTSGRLSAQTLALLQGLCARSLGTQWRTGP
jgi:hypothetical protein